MSETRNVVLGEFIKERREALGMNKRQLAIALHVAPSTVGRWESGRSNTIRWEIAVKLSEVLLVPVSSFLRGGNPDHGEALRKATDRREKAERQVALLAAKLTDDQLADLLVGLNAIIKRKRANSRENRKLGL